MKWGILGKTFPTTKVLPFLTLNQTSSFPHHESFGISCRTTKSALKPIEVLSESI